MAQFFNNKFQTFPAGGGSLKNGSENTLQLPDLDNASVGKMETTGAPVTTGAFLVSGCYIRHVVRFTL